MKPDRRFECLRTSIVLCLVVGGCGWATWAQGADDASVAKSALEAAGIRAGCAWFSAAAGRSRLVLRQRWQNKASCLFTAWLWTTRHWRGHARPPKHAACGLLLGREAGLGPLPFLPDLANLIIVEDTGALSARGLKREDIFRVLAPGGVLCEHDGAAWKTTVKPRPKEMDEWTHPLHGPDGNLVSTDRVLGLPLGFRWLDGMPVSLNGVAGTQAVVVNSRLAWRAASTTQRTSARHTASETGRRSTTVT